LPPALASSHCFRWRWEELNTKESIVAVPYRQRQSVNC
jgi:hypothetical protein